MGRAEVYIPDYKGPDGWKRSRLESPFHVPALEEIGLIVDVAAVALQVIPNVGKDQLHIPQEYRRRIRTEEQRTQRINNLAQLIGRRYDPLYNLVKAQIHKVQQNDEAAEVAKFAGATIALSETGAEANPIGAGFATFFLDRAVIHSARREVARDKEGDEDKRLGDDWDMAVWNLVEEVAKQANLHEEEKRELREAAFQEVEQRHEAFYERFTRPTSDGKYRTTSALDDAIQVGVEYYNLTDGKEHLSWSHPWKRITRSDQAWELKQQFVTYVPEAKKYMTMKDLQNWIVSENADSSTRRRRLVDRTDSII